MYHNDCKLGVGMDIFVFSGCRKSKLGRSIQTKALLLMLMLLEKPYCKYKKLPLTTKRKIVSMFPEVLRTYAISFFSRIAIIDLDNCTECFDPDNMNRRRPSSDFLESNKIRASFENIKVWTFKNYNEILTNIYGDWKKLPPEEERTGHGDILIDLENDYSVYQHKDEEDI